MIDKKQKRDLKKFVKRSLFNSSGYFVCASYYEQSGKVFTSKCFLNNFNNADVKQAIYSYEKLLDEKLKNNK